MKNIMLALSLLIGTVLCAQNIDQKWILSQRCTPGYMLNFAQNPPSLDNFCPGLWHIGNMVSYTDPTTGQIRAYSNGCHIANALGQIMDNGDSLGTFSACDYIAYEGTTCPQWGFALPSPSSSNQVFLFHQSLEYLGNKTLALYYSIIDLAQNGGLGRVLDKNHLLLEDSLSASNFTACRHANGRDWWILQPHFYTNTYARFLLDPSGVHGPFFQQIGPTVPFGGGWRSQAAFSSDGEWYARNACFAGGLLFRFDRCTGLLYEPRVLDMDYDANMLYGLDMGSCFSPSSRFLYLGSDTELFQFDLQAPDIQATKTLLSTYNGTQDGASYPNYGTMYNGLDGKIYMAPGGTARYLHVINTPEGAGLACNFLERQVTLPDWRWGGLPNFPHYRLGALPGSPCDSLGLGVEEVGGRSTATLKAWPNPASGQVTLSFAKVLAERASLLVYTTDGRLVAEESVAAGTDSITLSLNGFATGVYFCTLVTDSGMTARTRFVVSR